MKLKAFGFWLTITASCLAAAEPTPATRSSAPIPEAVASAMKIPGAKERAKACEALPPVLKEWSQKDPVGVLTWLNEARLSHQIRIPTAGPWAIITVTCGHEHGRVSVDWSMKTTGHPFLHFLLFFWSSTDPQGALDWFHQTSMPDDARYNTFYTLWDGLIDKDKPLALAELAKVQPAIDREAAIRGMMARWSKKDFQAATEWIKQQKDGDLKAAATTVLEVNKVRFSNKDKTPAVAAMNAWLAPLPLSDSEKASAIKGFAYRENGPPKKPINSGG